MRKEMVIRIQVSSEKGYSKAIKAAAAVKGVESVSIAGEDKNLLLVIGDGIDSNRITKKLKQKVDHAEVVELRTVDPAEELAAAAEHAYRYHPSPGPGMYYTGGARDDRYYNSASVYPVGGGRGGRADDRYYNNAASVYPVGGRGGRDYYGGGYGGGGGGYPAQYQQQHAYNSYPSAASTQTVVHQHHSYQNDPNSCSIM